MPTLCRSVLGGMDERGTLRMAAMNTTLSENQLQTLRGRLEARRDELEEEINNLSADVQSMAEDEELEGGAGSNHPADEGSDVRDASQSLTIQQDLQEMQQQVVAALERMDEGTYGLCQQCGKPIDPERLDALPHAAYDIEHQAEMERNARL